MASHYVTVRITADLRAYTRAIWRAWYSIERRRRQDPDPNPFPRFHLFRKAKS